MLNIERRIAALESTADDGLSVAIVEDGESQADALVRLGMSPEVRAVYLSELDALI